MFYTKTEIEFNIVIEIAFTFEIEIVINFFNLTLETSQLNTNDICCTPKHTPAHTRGRTHMQAHTLTRIHAKAKDLLLQNQRS